MDPLIVALLWNIIITLLIQYHWKLEETFLSHYDLSDVFHDRKMQTDWTDNIGIRVGFLFFLAVILRTYSIVFQ